MRHLKSFLISLWDEDMEILLAALLLAVLAFGLLVGGAVQKKTDRQIQKQEVVYGQDRD